MKWDEQGIDSERYAVSPRTLVFLTHGPDVLLLRGAPDKRRWAGKLNGVGGHIEPGEDPLAGALREVQEETGLAVPALELRALVHVSERSAATGVMLFVYVGRAPRRAVRSGIEGELAWYPMNRLPLDELVEDLVLLLPRALHSQPGDMLYGNYLADDRGDMHFTVRECRLGVVVV